MNILDQIVMEEFALREEATGRRTNGQTGLNTKKSICCISVCFADIINKVYPDLFIALVVIEH